MTHLHPRCRLAAKGRNVLVSEWDQAAIVRHEQIISGRDLSFKHITMPTTLRLANLAPHHRVLDVGCGSGVLTKRLASECQEVVGIDPAPQYILIAREFCRNTHNALFVKGFVEDQIIGTIGCFDVAVANMVLMDCANLDVVLSSVAEFLTPAGCLVATITHPFYWAKYWGYDTEPWYQYETELEIEAPFVISTQACDFVTTHFHRPLSHYAAALAKAGMALTEIEEPMPTEAVAQHYPSPWKFPRFLAFRAVKLS